MLTADQEGNKKVFRANTEHPLYKEIHNIILKYVGLDQIVEHVVKRLGDVEKVFLAGKFSRGMDSQVIDLIFIGNIDRVYLIQLIEKAEGIIKRKIRYLIYQQETEADWSSFDPEPLLLWKKD